MFTYTDICTHIYTFVHLSTISTLELLVTAFLSPPCLPVFPLTLQENYLSHMQGQIKDLERYISFLQTKQTCSLPDPERLVSPSPDPSHDQPHLTSSHTVKPKKVTFSDDVPSLRGSSEEKEHLDPPVPQYKPSLTQLSGVQSALDGVHCPLDSSQCEWEKADNFQRQYDLNKVGLAVEGRREGGEVYFSLIHLISPPSFFPFALLSSLFILHHQQSIFCVSFHMIVSYCLCTHPLTLSCSHLCRGQIISVSVCWP